MDSAGRDAVEIPPVTANDKDLPLNASVAKPLVETVDPAATINHFLLARVKRMTL